MIKTATYLALKQNAPCLLRHMTKTAILRGSVIEGTWYGSHNTTLLLIFLCSWLPWDPSASVDYVHRGVPWVTCITVFSIGSEYLTNQFIYYNIKNHKHHTCVECEKDINIYLHGHVYVRDSNIAIVVPVDIWLWTCEYWIKGHIDVYNSNKFSSHNNFKFSLRCIMSINPLLTSWYDPSCHGAITKKHDQLWERWEKAVVCLCILPTGMLRSKYKMKYYSIYQTYVRSWLWWLKITLNLHEILWPSDVEAKLY